MNNQPPNLFANAGYRYFLGFNSISSIGGGFHFIASYWLLYSRTESSSAVAWLIIAFWLPSVLVMPFGGVLLDRWNRRRFLVGLSVYFALLDGVLAAIMMFGHFVPNYLYVYAGLTSFAWPMVFMANQAYLKGHLSRDELLQSNSYNTAMFQGGYLAGAGIAGWLYPQIGAAGCFVINGLSMLVATVGWLTITRWFPDAPQSASGSADRASFLDDYRVGLRYIRNDVPLFLFALFAIVPRLASQVLNVVVIAFAMDVLRCGAFGFGLLDMSYGVGAMLCAFAFPALTNRWGLSPLLPTTLLVITAGVMITVSFTESIGAAMFAIGIFGAGVNLVGVISNTVLQRDVPLDVIGRITSVVQFCQLATIPPAVWLIGQYADREAGAVLHVDIIRDSFVVSGVVFLAIGIVSMFVTRPFIARRGGIRAVKA